MRTTTGTKNKIKKFEGLRLKAYVCAAGEYVRSVTVTRSA